MTQPSGDLWGRFLETAARRPDAAAIVHGTRSCTFSELVRRSSGWAVAFAERGVRHGDRIAILGEPSAGFAGALLGAWALGAIPVILDVAESPKHLEHALATTEPTVVVAPSPPAGPWASMQHEPEPVDVPPVPRATGRDFASIVFTSGSTGLPKGVVQRHATLIAGCEVVGRYLGLSQEDRILCPIPWAFDYGYGQLLSTVLLGPTQVLPSELTAAGIQAAVEAHRPTVFAGVPSIFTYLFRGISDFPNADVRCFRVVTNTGGTIAAPVLADLIAKFEGARVFLNYGLTETYRTSFLDPSLVQRHPTSIGRPLEGVDVRILGDDGQECAAGEEGQLIVRGGYFFDHYWNAPEATARMLRPDPFGEGLAVFTGDYGRRDDDGLLYFHGRRDRLLKSLGVRVNAMEVVDTLMASELLADAGVYGVDHELFGHQICAAVVLRPGATLAEVRKYCRTAMSEYMLPRRITAYDVLPKTRTGKVDIEALKKSST